MRKNEMKQLDLAREKNLALSDLELEAREKAEHLLTRAKAMRLEQEDEIKHLNEVGYYSRRERKGERERERLRESVVLYRLDT